MAATAAIPMTASRVKARSALIASADVSFRQRLSALLSGLRWHVREADGGAQAWGEAMDTLPQTLIVDSWLPDLDVSEFLKEFRNSFPSVDVIAPDSSSSPEGKPGPYRQEILYALRRSQDSDTAAWNAAPELGDSGQTASEIVPVHSRSTSAKTNGAVGAAQSISKCVSSETLDGNAIPFRSVNHGDPIPELIGKASCMLEVSRRIRLVAPRTTPVLIEGPTGSGKEIVAESLHRLSARSRRPFVAINCAAIPGDLLEAELFGHTRGAFTGAVQGRIGRIESADGGTLFLDEIGEMPLALQSKLLRFVESGELQRVGDNETVKVDVRVIAATHQPLVQHTQSGGFRSDLYYRLAVFLIRTPALADHLEDLPLLVNHFLERLGRAMPVKRIDGAAMQKLMAHTWPGNVRELEHVLERAAILAGQSPVLTPGDIDFGCDLN